MPTRPRNLLWLINNTEAGSAIRQAQDKDPQHAKEQEAKQASGGDGGVSFSELQARHRRGRGAPLMRNTDRTARRSRSRAS